MKSQLLILSFMSLAVGDISVKILLHVISEIFLPMLEKMWRKRNHSGLLVGMQTGAATVENSREFPPKIKNGTAF